METAMIHRLWQLVEATQVHELLALGDHELIQWLTSELTEQQKLSKQQNMQVQNYVSNRLFLIREVAKDA